MNSSIREHVGAGDSTTIKVTSTDGFPAAFSKLHT